MWNAGQLVRGNGRYTITFRSLAYYFGSVADVRFIFNADKIVYDRNSGKVLQDYVNVQRTNTQPSQPTTLVSDIVLSVVGQQTESDGYVDDYAIEIANVNPSDKTIYKNPDFFVDITGTSAFRYVFFQTVIDANLLSRKQIIPTSSVNASQSSKSAIERIKYDYPPNQLYYAYAEDKFYIATPDSTVANVLNLIESTDYSRGLGRQGLTFQYRHNSNTTTRVDPSTSNIIDLYLVTQSYYTDYQNWIKDTTGAVAEPLMPDMYQLSQSYAQLQDFKMVSDSVILNSVKFKPLFGSKADKSLQATIKVIKTSGSTASEGEIKSAVLAAMNDYFAIENWNFGDTFYFSELSAYLHRILGDLISSAILVPNDPNAVFGDLYEIRSAPHEIFVSAATASDILVITSLTSTEFKN